MKCKNLILAILALLVLTGCQKPVEIHWVLAQEGVYTLSDGTRVDLWEQEQFQTWRLYKLPDGAELLRENTPFGPDSVSVVGQISFQSLSDTAQTEILAYYEDRGLLYDIPAELEKAYQAYRRGQESGEEWSRLLVAQQIAPRGSNDTVCYYETSVTTSLDVQLTSEVRLCDAFRRDTGEKIEPMDLFTVSQEEAARWFADYYGAEEPLNGEMCAAFRPEYVIFQSGGLELLFPAGTLPSQESATGLYLEHGEAGDILQEWAVPVPLDD